jgi:hypothetical protein
MNVFFIYIVVWKKYCDAIILQIASSKFIEILITTREVQDGNRYPKPANPTGFTR